MLFQKIDFKTSLYIFEIDKNKMIDWRSITNNTILFRL